MPAGWRAGCTRAAALILIPAATLAWAAVIAGYLTSRAGVLAATAATTAAAGLLIGQVAARAHTIIRLRRHGQITSALITSRQQTRGQSLARDFAGTSGHNVSVTVSYTDTTGQQVTGKYSRYPGDPDKDRTGQMIQILYDPRRPARFRLVSGQEDTDLFFGGVGVVCFLAMTATLLYHALR